MDNALEASSQRICHHLRRPLAGRRDLLNENAGNTLNETDPQLPVELEQAALVDGCTPGQAFRKVIMPLAAPGVFTTAIITFIAA